VIKVLFFASLRDRLGVAELSVSADEAGDNVASLRRFLAARGEAWAEALGEGARVLAAINQQMVDMGFTVEDGDEVAFFPPVTGG
jgi:molybdopterin synthase sulfur carrier subunit